MRFLVSGYIAMLLTLSAPAKAALIVDQIAGPFPSNQADFVVGTASNGGQELAQTFTVGLSGTLSSVGLQINRYSSQVSDDPTTPLTVQILGTNNGIPDASNVLLSTTVAASSIPVEPVFVNGGLCQTSSCPQVPFLSVDLSSFSLQVVQGEVLAIFLERITNGTLGWEVGFGSGDNYLGGQEFLYELDSSLAHPADTFFASCDGGAFCPRALGFDTTVDQVGQVPEPSTLPLVAFGLVALALGRLAPSRSARSNRNATRRLKTGGKPRVP